MHLYIAAGTPRRALVDYGGDYWALTDFGSKIVGMLWAGFFDRISASIHFVVHEWHSTAEIRVRQRDTGVHGMWRNDEC